MNTDKVVVYTELEWPEELDLSGKDCEHIHRGEGGVSLDQGFGVVRHFRPDAMDFIPRTQHWGRDTDGLARPGHEFVPGGIGFAANTSAAEFVPGSMGEVPQQVASKYSKYDG
mmetsp:Transcript_15021/g.23923  ORF Transcript_15021/g.23923 Transcript_15021/m.23923 type:complete len:113 (+) Transcript_15021:102-440(+)